ncbi:MAG: zinc ribbon domain-containing protein [Lachnospiraceae bacterium]|nr:zinc ribbon domain-containing protein [Lachnospiraceae bacterium]
MANKEFLDALDEAIEALTRLRRIAGEEEDIPVNIAPVQESVLPDAPEMPSPQPMTPPPVMQPEQGGNACPNCGIILLPGTKFCKQCGTPVQAAASTPPAGGAQFCLNCGEMIAPGTKFCKKCGTPVG